MTRYAFENAPRCTATSKRTKQRCRAPAVKGWTVCRNHGAGGGAPRGERNGMYRHGLYTKEAIAERRALAKMLRQCREELNTLGKPDH
jgi:hypothetical protein